MNQPNGRACERGGPSHAPDAATVARRAEIVRNRIADAGADPRRVTLIAVTKGFGREVVDAALAAGLVDLGESYAQELAARLDPPPRPVPRWHMVGRLQRNKVRTIADAVGLWHSVDRVEVGIEIAKRAPGASVLVQVNASEEEQKGGCVPADAPGLVADLRAEGLAVEGLMTVAAAGGPELARPCFRRLRDLADRLALVERSMGMSGDLEAAVAEGATMVRVGSALFGPRPGRPGANR